MIALLIGRFHALTREQAKWIASLGEDHAFERVVCVIASANHAHTRRNPLDAAQRTAMLAPVLQATELPYDIVPATDVSEDAAWVPHVLESVKAATGLALAAQGTIVLTANRDVAELCRKAGFGVRMQLAVGLTPHELVQRIVDGRPWRDDAAPSTVAVYERDGLVATLRGIFGQRLINDDGELAHQRDFHTYSTQMDASLRQKLEDIEPWVLPGRVVDKGCGTGKLMVELSRRFPGSAFVGVDLSREFLRRSDENTYFSDDVTLVFGDAADQQVESGTATTVIFASIMHEIYSYGGYDLKQVDRALASAARELKPGGRLVMRDGVSPGLAPWRLRLCKPGLDTRWAKFCADFKHGTGVPHERLDGGWIRASAHLVNEFLCKKDYLENWHIEVDEEYGALTCDGWRAALDEAGFDVVAVKPYVNGWIAKNRYEGCAELTDDAGAALPWPATNVVVVGEKR